MREGLYAPTAASKATSLRRMNSGNIPTMWPPAAIRAPATARIQMTRPNNVRSAFLSVLTLRLSHAGSDFSRRGESDVGDGVRPHYQRLS